MNQNTLILYKTKIKTKSHYYILSLSFIHFILFTFFFLLVEDFELISRLPSPFFINTLQVCDVNSTFKSFQVLTCLRFLAKGDYLSETTDIHGISKSSGCLAVHRVVDAVCKALQNIEFPTRREHISRIKASFYKIAGFPNVIGAIDGTQIPIQGMGTDDEHLYVCRKGFHSINVQAVVDADLRFGY